MQFHTILCLSALLSSTISINITYRSGPILEKVAQIDHKLPILEYFPGMLTVSSDHSRRFLAAKQRAYAQQRTVDSRRGACDAVAAGLVVDHDAEMRRAELRVVLREEDEPYATPTHDCQLPRNRQRYGLRTTAQSLTGGTAK